MPKKMDRCVDKVKKTGKDTPSAHAICTDAWMESSRSLMRLKMLTDEEKLLNSKSPVAVKVMMKGYDNEMKEVVHTHTAFLSSTDVVFNTQAIAEAMRQIQIGMEFQSIMNKLEEVKDAE